MSEIRKALKRARELGRRQRAMEEMRCGTSDNIYHNQTCPMCTGTGNITLIGRKTRQMDAFGRCTRCGTRIESSAGFCPGCS